MDQAQSGMFPQSQIDRPQFAAPTQMPVSREVVNADFDAQVDPYNGQMQGFDKGGHVRIKSLARELPQYGRNGDTMVAHINPQEAQMLKAMGGSGTINPVTGLPEFGLGSLNPFKSGSIYEKAAQGISGGLASLDKAVGNVIPGGWGTVANVAGSAMGLPTPMLVGMGALTGSGALKPNGKFNLQGALMGGALAYGNAKLGDALRAAGSVTPVGTPSVDLASVVTPSPTSGIDFSNVAAGSGGAGITGAPSSGIGFNTPSMTSGLESFAPKPTFGDSLGKMASEYGQNVSNYGQGIANISGLGPTGVTGEAARSAFGNSGATFQNTAMPIFAGATGLSAIDAQNQAIKDSEAQNNTANAQYNAEMAAILEGENRAKNIMNRNPYQFASGGMMPRFLSGGGDGLSDDINATINGNQPAKLADGEFVISADVVSNLGGGSSKAGAKKLYAMMDRVRKQAHGSKKQIRPVSNKALPV